MRNRRLLSQAGGVLCAIAISIFLGEPLLAASPDPTDSGNPVKHLSLSELGDIEVTTASRQPERVMNTTAAIYVVTQEDIERSGAKTIPDALRLVPGVEVAQIVGRNLFQPHHIEYSGVDPGPDIGIKRSAYGQITWTR